MQELLGIVPQHTHVIINALGIEYTIWKKDYDWLHEFRIRKIAERSDEIESFIQATCQRENICKATNYVEHKWSPQTSNVVISGPVKHKWSG